MTCVTNEKNCLSKVKTERPLYLHDLHIFPPQRKYFNAIRTVKKRSKKSIFPRNISTPFTKWNFHAQAILFSRWRSFLFPLCEFYLHLFFGVSTRASPLKYSKRPWFISEIFMIERNCRTKAVSWSFWTAISMSFRRHYGNRVRKMYT